MNRDIAKGKIKQVKSKVKEGARHSEFKTVRVLLMGFNPIVRGSLQAILAMDYDIETVPDSEDADQALLQLKQASDRGLSIHIVLTEARTITLDGIHATRLIKQAFPEIPVLVLTENLNDSYVIEAIHAGAAGYIFLKDMSPESLLQSIHRVVEGSTQRAELVHAAVEILVQNGRKTLAERVVEAAHLTQKEADVLRLMGNGDSNKTIAKTLGITLDATKKHVHNGIDKLQARSRTHAAIIVAQAGIVSNSVIAIPEVRFTVKSPFTLN